MAASLTAAHRSLLCNNLLLFPAENLKNKSWKSKEQPFNRNPVPTHKTPPQTAVVLVLELNVIDNVYCNVFVTALGAFH